MTERLLRDLHPVELSIDDKVILGARVFVTTERIVAYVEREVSGHYKKQPTIALSTEITGDLPEPNRGSLVGMIEIPTAEGTVRLNRGYGCGCHSVLKMIEPVASW